MGVKELPNQLSKINTVRTRTKELPSKSYHETSVVLNGKELVIFNQSYGLQLILTRAGGWSLYNMWGGKEELLGGEYDFTAFEIKMNGVSVFANNYARTLNRKKTQEEKEKYLLKLKKQRDAEKTT